MIRRAQAGDERMYRELVSRYVRPALAVAWELTETLDDPEDLVQEAFRRVTDALDRFDPDRPFAPWFFTILRNVARTAAGERPLRLHAALDASVPDEGPTPADLVECLELQARVDLELESLPDMQRACFRLCALEGLSSGEVAVALGVSEPPCARPRRPDPDAPSWRLRVAPLTNGCRSARRSTEEIAAPGLRSGFIRRCGRKRNWTQCTSA